MAVGNFQGNYSSIDGIIEEVQRSSSEKDLATTIDHLELESMTLIFLLNDRISKK